MSAAAAASEAGAVWSSGWVAADRRTSGQMTAEKDTPTPTNMYKSKSGGAPSDGQAREK